MERKMKFFANLKKGILAASCAVAALLVSSCEIGLGAAVDTERPKIQITYPPKGAIIMDTFTLAGTVSDDVGLNYLNVTLTNKDLKTQYTYSSKEGQVSWVDPGKNWSKGTTWTASIGKKTEGQTLYNGWDLPDGEYFIEVEANDGYGSIVDRRSVIIDNTPPVFIVENLISMEGNNEDTSVFGHKINLIGQSKDENGISKVHFTAYDDKEGEILSANLDYEMTSNGVVLAKYSKTVPADASEKVLADNFNAIYGTSYASGENDEKLTEIATRYLTAKLSDNARKYVSPVFQALDEEAEKNLGTGDGNLSTEMYLKTQDFKQEGISIDELKEYKKHLSDNKALDDKLSLLASTSIASVNASGNFTNVPKLCINPKLEPTWYINNYGYDYKTEAPSEILYIGSPLTFNFEWGNNKEKFRPSNIRVVLARIDDNGNLPEGITEEKIKNTAESNKDIIILVPNGEWSEDLTETFTKSVKLDNELITPDHYRVYVFGHDGSGEDGEQFVEKDDKAYGFKAKKNIQDPKIVFLSAQNGVDENGKALPKDGSGIGPGTAELPFWFKVLTDGEKLKEIPEVKLKVGVRDSVLDTEESYFLLEKNPSVLSENPGIEMDGEKEKLCYEFKWTLKQNPAKPLPTKETNPEWNDEFDFIITVSVADMGGADASKNIAFELDNKQPEVTIGDVTSPDMEKTGNKLNGEVKIPVSFDDNNPKLVNGKNQANYKVYDDSRTVLDSGTVENDKEITLDTVSYPASIVLEISAEDKFGNIGVAEKTYEVNQATDTPIFSFTNLKANAVNSFGIKNNNVIELSVSDDDVSFGKLEVRVRDATAADWTDNETGWYTINTEKTSANWNFTKELVESDLASALISDDGKYKVQFRGTDSVGLVTGIALSEVYDVIADSTKPVFGTESVPNVVKDSSEYYVKADTTAKISIPLTEKNLKTVTVNGQVITPEPVPETDGTYNVKYDWVPGNKASGIYELEFVAEDESANSNFKTVTLHYVKELPKFAEVEVTPEVLAGNKVNGIISFKGSVDQSTNETKIINIKLELKQNGIVLDSKTENDSASFEWKNINTTAFTDNKALDLVIIATDIAGNSNEPKEYTVNIDQSTDLPKISFEEEKIDVNLTSFADVEDGTKNPGGKKNLLGIGDDNSSFYVYATDDDAVKEITVQAYVGDSNTTVDAAKTFDGKDLDTENKVECKLSDLGITTAGNYKIVVSATDDEEKTGLSDPNPADPKTLYIVVDGVAPEIANVKVAGIDYAGQVYINGEKQNITFDVKEMHLASVTVNGTSLDLGTPDTSTGSKVYSYTVPYTPKTANAAVVIKATDSTGMSSEKELTINHDKAVPVINTPTVTPTVFNDGATVNGLISITGTVSDESGYEGVAGKVENEKLEVKLERLDGTTWSEISGATFTVKNQKYTLTDFDTTTLKDKTVNTKPFNGKIRISVLATDRAGNASGKTPKYFEYTVDQDTDLPSFRFTNIDADATDAAENLMGLGKWKITGAVKDDDGAVKLYYKKGDAYEPIDLSAIDNNNEQAFTFEVPHSAGEKGNKSVEFLCVENEGAADSSNKKTPKTILYAIDNQKPEFTARSLNGRPYETGLFAGAKRTIALEVSDDNGITKVEYYTPAAGETSASWTELTLSSGKYTHEIDESAKPSDGEKTNRYRVTDIYGRETETELTYKVDTTSPDDTKVKVKVADADYDSKKWLGSGSVIISIKGITDDNLADTVTYEVGGSSSGSGNVQIISGEVSNTLALSDGNSEVTYTFSDKAGNKTDVKLYINVDTKAPVASVTELSGVKKPGALTLKFSATDDQTAQASLDDEPPAQSVSGLAYAYIGISPNFSLITKDGANEYLQKIELFETTGEGVTTYPVTKTDLTASVTIPSSDGKYQYYLVLEDRAGKTSNYVSFGEFTIDGTDPVVKINDVADAESSTVEEIDVNKTFRISGTAEDDHPSTTAPVLAVYEADANGKKSGNAINITGLYSVETNSFASWAYAVDTTKLGTAGDNKKYVFELTATDSAVPAGNTGSAYKVLKVNQTSDRPVINLGNIITKKGEITLSEGKIEWTASDDDGISVMAVKVMRKDGKNADGTDKWTNVETSSDGFKTVSLIGGKYSYEIPKYTPSGATEKTADGSYKLYFKVTDAKSTFVTPDTSTDALTEPRIYEADGKTRNGTSISFDVDGTPPVIGKVMVNKTWKETTSGNGESAKTIITYTDVASEFKSSVHYGGPKYRYAKLTIPVSDNVCPESGMTVKVKVGDNEADAVYAEGVGFVHEIDFRAKNKDGSFKIASGPVTVRIDAADKSDEIVSKYFNIYVDNLGPNEEGKAVQNMTPSEDTEVTAIVSIAANINDDSTANSRVASVKYYVPKNNGKAAGEEGRVVETTPSETTPWSITDLSFSDVVMKLELKGLATSEGNIEADYAGHEQTAQGSGVYFLPVWFRLEDNCGNISYVEKIIRYNPDAVRPRIKQTFPVHNKTVGTGASAKNYVVLGGTILLAGSAEDNVAIDAVYVQYDVDGDGKYSKDDVEYLINAGYTVVKIENGTQVSYTGTVGSGLITVTDSIFTSDTDTCDKWGIKADGTGSWNTEFAASGLSSAGLEIGAGGNTTNKTLNIRMCARDKDTPTAHTSAWTDELHVSVNNSVPQFGKFYLVQYADADGTEYKRVPYENGMFIKGSNWCLEGTVVDNDGISSVKAGSTEYAEEENFYTDPATENTEHPYTGYTVKVPVSTNANGKFSVTLTATDNAQSGQGITLSQYEVNVDNTPPAFKDGANDDALVLYAGDYNGKKELGSDYKLQNSNGWTTIASKVKEEGSGFKRAVFYVERNNSAGTARRFYNVMNGDRIEASAVGGFLDNLPYVTKEITQVSGNSYQFTLSDSTWDENIRVGGLVVIGNVYKTITEIDKENKKVTVDDQILGGWTSGKQNAQFIYAFVVDHTGESTNSDKSIKNDDGDGIVESITKSAGEYIWDVSFDSSKIPDGPLTVHVVVFDEAGNTRHGTVVTRAANNAPRITSVKIGTDLNYNEEIQDTPTYSEYTQFYAITNSHGEADLTQGKEVWNLVPSDEVQSKDRAWVIKKDLSLKPEFVGGKAPFYYVFSKKTGTGDNKRLTTPEAGTNLSQEELEEGETDASGDQGQFAEHGALKVENDNLKLDDPTSDTKCEDHINTYRFTFWDSTEESTPGSDTGWCILNVELYQDLEDTNKPKAHVHPFFWNGRGAGNNSVTWATNTTTNKVEPQGHIELEGELTSDITGTTVNGTALGSDPKVSGTIVIRGTAYDDTRLSKVIVTYEGIINGTTNICEASYDGSDWTDDSTKNKGYSLSVTDLNGGVTQNGHLVEWALTIDTSKVVTDAVKETGLDKKVVVKAVDAASETAASKNLESDAPASGASTTTANVYYYATEEQAALGKYYATAAKALDHKTDYKTADDTDQTEIFDRVVEKTTADEGQDASVNKYKVYGTNSQYQMDIVPYVTEVVTSLSDIRANNPSMYNRTSLGHYPVSATVPNSNKATDVSETVTLKGFNLGNGATVTIQKDGDDSSKGTISGTATNGSITFSVKELKSGKGTITVNSIPLMNNINDNAAKGDCASANGDSGTNTNCYNKVPNLNNNNLLTDDIVFDVWEFNNDVARPITGFMGGLDMKINQNNGMLQYAFTNGNLFFSLGGNVSGTAYSSYYWMCHDDYMAPTSVGFIVDNRGKTFAAAHGGDDTDYYTLMSDDWGTATKTQAGGDNRPATQRKNTSPMVRITGSDSGLKERIMSSAFASSENNVLYLAYFDMVTGDIRLKSGETGTYGSSKDVTNNIANDNDEKTFGDFDCKETSNSNSKVIADKTESGQHVSIAVSPKSSSDSTDVLCAVWFNKAGKLMYKYMENPTATNSTWQGTINSVFTDGGGEYCKIAVDALGGVHIAAYVAGTVQYAYAPSYKDTFKTCKVDNNDVGKNLTLDVALDSNGKAVPQIGYYSGVYKAKMAKLADTSWYGTTEKKPVAGVGTDNTYTGSWDVSYVPSPSTLAIEDEDRINIGLWKYTSATDGHRKGEIKTSAVYSSGTTLKTSTWTSTFGTVNKGTNIGQNATCYSQTYGNGTSNAVLCYLTQGGARMETAQLRD